MIKKYIHYRKVNILSYLFILCIYLVIVYLYQDYLEPVLYASLIIFVFLIFLFCFDYYLFVKKYTTLKKLENSPTTISAYLPQTNNDIENEYSTLISLLNSQFIEYQNQMDSANQEREDYFSLWTHQIKTPISAIHLLVDDRDDTELKTQLFLIEEYVSLALGYLRATSVSSDLVLKKCNIEDICKSCIRHYSPLFIKKKLSLNFTPFHYELITDEKWLSFVIEQILSNALKYTNTGSISIYMKNNQLIIEDTGIGISESDLPRVFGKNYTGTNGHASSNSSGMGLYLCKLVLDKLSHEISITSKVNVGTKVIITLQKCKQVKD